MFDLLLDTPVSTQARFYHGLADPLRLAILVALRRGELTVGEVAEAVGCTMSGASRHLACLKGCGLLECNRDWRHVRYRLAPGVDDLLRANAAFIDRVSDLVQACDAPEMLARKPDRVRGAR